MSRNKPLIFWLMIAIGTAGVLNTLALSFFTNINIGTVIPGAAGGFIIIYAIIRYGIRKGMPLVSNRMLRRIFSAAIILFAVSFIAIEGLIIADGNSHDKVKTDYLIILGAGLRGETVSLTLMERLEKGVGYLKEYPDAKVIVSGGQGRGESITEAEAMRRYLVRKGIGEERIIKEDRATSTMENIKFSKEILEKQKNGNTTNVMIITSDFHMMRAKMLAARNGLKPYGVACYTPVSVRLNCYIREYLAVIKSLLLDR